MTEIDDKIIRHIARYRVTLREVLTKIFFDGSESRCDNAITRLKNAEQIVFVKGLQGRYSYYHLTEKEASRRGVNSEWATPPQPRALAKCISVLWFCCMGERRRYLLDNKELRKLVGRTFNVPYCIEEPNGDDGARIYRILTPGAKTKLSTIAADIRKHLNEASAFTIPGAPYNVGDMMKEHAYAVAVLVDDDGWRERFNALVNGEKSDTKAMAKIVVETVASPLTLKSAIDEKRKAPVAGADPPVSKRPGKRTGRKRR